MRSKLLTEEVFCSQVLFLSGGDEATAAAKAAAWFKEQAVKATQQDIEPTEARGRAFFAERFTYCLWVRDGRDVAAIAHEAIHIGVSLLECVGMPINGTTDEALAYYCDWLIRAALKRS